MAFEPKPNTGSLWPNDYKKQDNHPDVKGDLFISRELLRTLASENKDELIKVAVAGWKKTLGGKNCLTLSVSQPYQKAKDDGDVPF